MSHPAPHSPEAEKAVLGSILRDNAMLDDVTPIVSEDDFYADAHRKVWRAIAGLIGRGKPADLVTVAQELYQHGILADVGYALIGELWDAAPTAANGRHYAEAVRERALTRELLRAGLALAEAAQAQHAPAAELLADAERALAALSDRCWGAAPVPLVTLVNETLARYEGRKAGATPGAVPTGLGDLDMVLGGGLHAGSLVLLAGRTSTGKTALALDWFRRMALAGRPSLFASLEMDRGELGDRILAAATPADLRQLQRGRLTRDDEGRLLDAAYRLRAAVAWVDDSRPQSVPRIAAAARKLKRKEGLAAVFVDYLQLVDPLSRRVNRYEQVGQVSRDLKTLAGELRVPVVALAQLRRGAEDRDRPRLSDLRESGNLEQDADVVLLLNRPDFHDPDDRPGELDVDVAKQRNGPTRSVTLHYRRETQEFTQLGHGPGGPPADPFGPGGGEEDGR